MCLCKVGAVIKWFKNYVLKMLLACKHSYINYSHLFGQGNDVIADL